MAVDPNVYALSIQLQLDAQEAFDTLDRFGESVTSIEEQVSSAAENAFGKINNLVKQVESSLSGVIRLLASVDVGAVGISESFESAARSAESTHDASKDDLKELLKQRDIWEEVVGFYDNITEELEDHLKLHNKDIKLLEGIHRAILTKNTGHSDENDLIETENQLIQQSTKSMGKHSDSVRGLTQLWHGVKASISGALAMLLKADAGTEAFVQTNYRAYGAQVQLLQTTRQLSAELGVSQEVVIATYKALADVRTPRDEIEKYATVVAIANRTTGVAIGTIANYTRSLRVAGVSLAQTEKHITYMTEAMRKFGLTQDDVNRLMSTSSADMLTFRRILGGNAEEVAKFKETITVFAGVAKSIGASTEAAQTLEKHLSNPINWKVLGQMTGVAIQNTDDLRIAMMQGGKQLSELSDEIAAAAARGEDVTSLNIKFQTLSDLMYGSAEAGEVAAKLYEKVRDELALAGDSADDFEAVQRALAKVQSEQLAESNNTLTAQWNIMRNAFGALTGSLLEFIADGLKYLIKAVNMVLVPIASFVTWIMKWVEWFENTIPVLGWFITALKIIAAIVFVAIASFVAMTSALAIFSGGIGMATAAVSGAMTIITSISSAIFTVASAIGRSITVILTGLGNGLASLGNSVRGVMVPLLALSLGLILVATAAYVFAQAVKIIAEVGWSAVPAMLGLIAAIGILGLVLVGLGSLAQGPVALGIIVIGAALLMAGAAALMMGLGMLYAAQGLEIIADIVGVDLLMQLPMLGMALVTLGAAALIAFPGLMMLGAALMLIGVGAAMFGGSISTISESVESIADLGFDDVADSFMQGSIKLAAAAGLMVIAGGSMIAAAVILIPAAYAMMGASFSLRIMGSMFSSAVNTIAPAANTLAPAAESMKDAGTNMIDGASKLSSCASMLLSGMNDMKQAAIMMRSSSSILLTGSDDMLLVSKSMSKAGAALSPASRVIYIALQQLEFSISKFSKTVDKIKIVSDSMRSLSDSFMLMKDISGISLKKASDDALSALPNIDKMAFGLSKSSDRLRESTSKFSKPAGELASVLERLSASISGFDEGITLGDDIDSVAVMLDEYTTLLENAADRIDVAVRTRAIPALKAAEEAGLEEAVRSEAISTVKVMTSEEDDARNDEMLVLATGQLAALNKLASLLAEFKPGENSQVADITSLLQTYLPDMAKKDSGLSTEFNGWSK